jgi:hypothetical protein
MELKRPRTKRRLILKPKTRRKELYIPVADGEEDEREYLLINE